MGASRSTGESAAGEERFSVSCFDLDSVLNDSLDATDSYIEIDLSPSESAACDTDVDAEFEFRVSFSSPLSGYPRQLPADMLFNNGQLLPLHRITSPSDTDAGSAGACRGDSTPGSNCARTGIPTEHSCAEVMSSHSQSIQEAKRPGTRWKLLSFRKSSSKVGTENEQGRKANGVKPADDGELMADRNVRRSVAENAKGVRKLLVKLRPREVGEFGWMQKQPENSPLYPEASRRLDKRMRRAKEILDRYWRIVNPFKGSRPAEEGESCEGRVFVAAAAAAAAAASFGASCRDTGVRSCPTSVGSSPIHRRVNSFVCGSRELSVRERDCSLQAAIAHCKKSFGVTDGSK
ncbi:unnamed protein product [Victoria cruziana]